MRYHVMSEDRSENLKLIACRASQDCANVIRDHTQAVADREERFLVVWVDPVSDCKHS